MLYLGGTPDQIMSAMAAAVLDEINTLRTNGVLGLAAITPTAWVAKIAAKKT
jgi:hypothetical protein